MFQHDLPHPHRSALLKTLALGLLATIAACGEPEPSPIYPATHHEAMQQGPGETWAMMWVIPVRWTRNFGMESGTGEVIHHAKSFAVTENGTRTDQVRLCGVQQPSYRLSLLLGTETYGPQYPVAPFDAEDLPTRTMTTRIGEAGKFTSAPVALQLGVALDAPERAAWPAYGTPLPGHVSEQADGSPGFAVRMRTDAPFVAPPVTAMRNKRAHTFHVALRHLVGASGTRVSDTFWEGRAQVAGIAGKAALNSRVLGCNLDDGTLCSQGELTTLNDYSPAYKVTGIGRFVMQRVAADTTCETIRAMAFAP